MSTSIIDGTVAEVVPGRRSRGVAILRSVRFDLADGSSRTVVKSTVTQEIADALQPGTKGRFYLFHALDVRGIHGLRTADGRALYGFPTNNQKVFLIGAIVSLVWIAVTIVAKGGIPIFGAALLVFSGVCWFVFGKGKDEAKRQYEADAGYAAPRA